MQGSEEGGGVESVRGCGRARAVGGKVEGREGGALEMGSVVFSNVSPILLQKFPVFFK